ncbi:MAG: VCBS domain-containing protein [Sphingomonadales bacterium]|nr:VCBS domain-containing protein [Sphingomonadales bacterium]
MERRSIQQPAEAAGAAKAVPAGSTSIQPAGGVVQLPPGTRLDAIKLSGNDLIVTLPDGQVLVIIDGALQIPQVKIGPINIPAPTIAALIAGQEPEPAAGAPQSSGGNFEQTPGDIGSPFALGDLLPPTDFALPDREANELIPNAIDDEPEILITTPDQPAGATSATATVAEAALPPRGSEPAGSDPASTAEAISGTIQISALDQPSVVSVNGTVVTAIGQVIATPLGQITITSIAPDAIGYSYTLTDNSTDPNATDTVTVTVTDNDGDVATATLTLTITDDAPTARADTDDVADGTARGNVITGANTTSDVAGADTPGADGAVVSGVQVGSDGTFAPAGTAVNGQYGRLLIGADGTYVYIRAAGTPGGVSDVFTYRLTDGDGDTATATLTIRIPDSTPTLTVPSAGGEGTLVDEAGLPESDGGSPGSRAGDDSNATSGIIQYSAADGPAVITINGVQITGEGQEIQLDTGIFLVIAINPDSIEYAFVLTDNVIGDPASQPIMVGITDSDGDTISASFDIDILDDMPDARADTDSLTAGVDEAATGNVVTDAENDGGRDVPGADGATVTAISAGGENGTVGGATAGAYGALEIAADGSYRYVIDPENTEVQGLDGDEELTETFDYVLTDGDGDEVTATLTITIRGRDDGVTLTGLNPAGAEVTVAEASLSDGSNPDSVALTQTGSFSFDAADGIAALTIGGEPLFDGTVIPGLTIATALGILTITDFEPIFDAVGDVVGGTISYSYELIDNSLLHSGANGASLTESFAIQIVDSDGTTATASLDVQILDDNPVARSAPSITVAEDAPPISGNLLANDTRGADGAVVTSVTVGGVMVAVAATGTTSYTNANGTYSFQPNGAWTFDPVTKTSAFAVNADFTYTITDGDGDQSSALQQIRIADGTDPHASAPITLVVDDQNLETGSTPSVVQPVSASGQITFTAGSDAIASIGFGDLSTLDGGLSWTFESATQIIGWDADQNAVIVIDLGVSGNVATVTATLQYNYGLHPDTTIDDIANLGSITVVATDADGDTAAGTVNLSVSDDIPSISAAGSAAGLLVVDETDLATNATANFASLFNMTVGADMAGSGVTYSFEVTNASGLIDVATGQKIILNAAGNVVEGRLQGSPSTVAFRLTVGADGIATLDQIRAVRHPDASNPNDSVTLSPTLIRLTATITDGDGDHASATALVGAALVFKDDGPSISAANVDTNSITLTTQDADTRGAAFDTATADLSGAFSVSMVQFGADGPAGTGLATWSYSLALGSAVATTALFSNGVPVTLSLVSGEIVGSAGGTPIFSIAVNAATGIVTLTQFAEIDHPLPGSSGNYAAQLVTLAVNLVELHGTATIVDGDGDAISATAIVDLGGNIRFADDGPSISAGGTAPNLVVDESNFAVDATANLSGLFAVTTDFGADGPGSVAYKLGVTAGASGLIDSLTGEAVVLSITDGVISGRTATQEVFRISVDAAGVVTFDQSRAVIHSPDSGPDQIMFLSGSNLITLTAIVTDGDGDTAQTTADISGHFAIRDDAPVAVHDDDNVSRDGQIFADGNVLTGIGGTDENGMDGSPDSAGSDGGLRVVGVAFGATVGTLGTALAGAHGTITLAVDGSYRYDLDPNDPAVIALDSNETLTETFQYTVRDADGDASTATITISITGANDFPIARADTNWVLDGPSGSDPSATGNVLQNIAHPVAPFGSFADVADNDPDLEAITVTTAGTYVGLYGTLVIAADGGYTYTLDEDKAAVNALDAGQTLVDSFAYTISDGSLSVGSMLSVTVFGTNDAPTIGTAIARISEEGLVGGLPDNAPNATLDTTNSTAASGVLAIGDADAGETLTATLGNPGAVLTAGGIPVTWTGVGTGTLIGSAGGSEVIRVTLAANGAYTVTLSHAVDHPTVALEDLKNFSVPVSVSDGTVTTTSASAIQIVIEDDAPTAQGETGSSAQIQQDVNTLFILDFSDSIDSGELNTMIGAVQGALTQLDNAASGAMTIRFVIFSSGSFASPSFSNAADANAYLTSLNPLAGGERPSQALPPDGIGLNTNYSGAIQTALANFTAIPGASNQVFFLSDGNPNQQVQFGGVPPGVVNSLTASTATAWNSFIDNNHVNVTAIGIDNNPLQPLNIQRLRDVDLNDAPNNNPILVDDFQDLVATLLSVIVPSAVAGDLDANDAFGADGGRLLSITIGSTTYTWDGASSIAVSTGGTIAGSALNAVTTPMGGTLTLDFATGQYNYQPPSPITVTATEVFSYVVTDRDGDTATANLSVTITALAPPIAMDLDGDGVEFLPGAAGVRFDYDGDGKPESTAWVAADDGLLAIDKNGDGKINDGSELVFGKAGVSDLQGLAAAYDSNGDGKLDASDKDFAKFGIWQDANGNGVVDPGEYRSLIDAGIISISLVSDGKSYTAANGEVQVRGETIFTRADGSSGRLADAAFATNFATEQQRAAAAGTAGVSTAMLVAGLAAATPLAAQPPEAPLADDHMLSAAAIAPSAAAVVPADIHPADRASLLIHEFDSGPAIERVASDAKQQVLRHDESRQDVRTSDLDTSLDRAHAPLPDQADAASTPAPTAPETPRVDQVQMVMPPQAAVDAPVPARVAAIVTGALEGPEVNLDSLLGPAPQPQQPTPPLPLLAISTGGPLTEHIGPAGHSFMAGLAEQHVVAQLEQAAAAGHA